MAGPVYGSGFVDLKPQLSSGFAGGLGSQLTAGLGPVGKGVGLALGAGVIAGVAGAGILQAVGSTFDDAFDTIRVGTGATGDALDGLKGDFKAVFADVPTDAGSASTAIADLNTRLGLTGDQLQTSATQFLELSRITGTDLGANIESVTRAFGDWGVESDRQEASLDSLFRAAQASGATVDGLASGLVQYGAPLRQLGFSMGQSTALLGKFEQEGVNTELVMGSLRIAVGRLAKEGVSAGDMAEVFAERMADISSSTDPATKAADLFGQRAGPDMAAAIQEGRFELGAIYDAIGEGTETIAGAAKDTDDWRESWQMFKNKALLADEPIATRFFNFLGDAFDSLGPGVEVATGLIGDALAALGPVFETVSGFVSGFIDLFRGSTDEIGGAADGILAKIGPLWEKITGMFEAGFAAISTIVEVYLNIITEFWNRYGRQIVEYVGRQLERVINVISGALDIITGIFDVVTGILTGDWAKAWDGIKSIVSGAWDIIFNLVSGAFDAIKTVFGAGIAVLKQIWSFLWEEIKKLASAAWQAIKDGFVDGLVAINNWFVELPGKIVGWLGDAGMWLFDVGIDIVKGLISGVQSMAGNLASGVGDFIYDQTVGRITGLFGIDSPSKVMAEYGHDVVRGFTAGVQAEAPEFIRQIDRLRALNLDANVAGVSAPETKQLTVNGNPDRRTVFRARQLLEYA